MFSAAVAWFVLAVATFPGEAIHNSRIGSYLPSKFLVGGQVNELAGKPQSMFSNVLILLGEKFTEDEKLEGQERSVSLRGRDLREAVLIRSDLRKADFSGANLNGANFYKAKLQGAWLSCIETSSAGKKSGRMVPFDLRPPAVLRWPYDGCSWLQGANLQEAELQGTSLEGAKLQGANLSLAQLQASSLKSAWLDAASLFGSELQGAILNGARLHGASLNGAQLQGAVVSDVELDGASFGFTFILQGLNECARGCRGARIPKSSVWRMRGTPYSIKLTTFDMIDATTQPFPAKSFAKWRDGILNSLPDIKYREQARQRLSTLDPESQTPRDVVSERNWKQIESIRADESDFEGKILSFLSGLACASENAPFVAKGLIRNERFGAAGLMLPQLIQKLRDTRQCPGAAELTVDDFDQLTRIAEHRQHELAGGKDAGVPDPQLPNRK